MGDSSDNLRGKTALITGSTSGIGLAIAKQLGKAGADVVMNGLGSRTEIDEAVAAVKQSAKGHVRFSDADVSNADAIEAMIADQDGVDILVNNAGIQFVAPVDEFPKERWDAIIAVNLSAVFHSIHTALPGMKKAGWGRIINIASAHALVASPYKSAYVSAKHGVAGLTKAVALEVARTGITVNAIAPGFVDTPLVEKQLDDVAKSHGKRREQVYEEVVVASQPSGRLVELDEVASLALYLCGDAAASITGAVLPVDGGWTAK